MLQAPNVALRRLHSLLHLRECLTRAGSTWSLLSQVPPTEPLPAKGAPRAPSSSARGSSDGLGPQGREQARSRTPGGAPRNAQTQPRGPPIFSPASQQRGGLAHGPSRTRAEPSTAGARERDAYGRPVAKPQPESSTGGPRPGIGREPLPPRSRSPGRTPAAADRTAHRGQSPPKGALTQNRPRAPSGAAHVPIPQTAHRQRPVAATDAQRRSKSPSSAASAHTQHTPQKPRPVAGTGSAVGKGTPQPLPKQQRDSAGGSNAGAHTSQSLLKQQQAAAAGSSTAGTHASQATPKQQQMAAAAGGTTAGTAVRGDADARTEYVPMQRIVRVGEPQPQYMAVQRRKKVPQVVLHGLLQLLLTMARANVKHGYVMTDILHVFEADNLMIFNPPQVAALAKAALSLELVDQTLCSNLAQWLASQRTALTRHPLDIASVVWCISHMPLSYKLQREGFTHWARTTAHWLSQHVPMDMQTGRRGRGLFARESTTREAELQDILIRIDKPGSGQPAATPAAADSSSSSSSVEAAAAAEPAAVPAGARWAAAEQQRLVLVVKTAAQLLHNDRRGAAYVESDLKDEITTILVTTFKLLTTKPYILEDTNKQIIQPYLRLVADLLPHSPATQAVSDILGPARPVPVTASSAFFGTAMAKNAAPSAAEDTATPEAAGHGLDAPSDAGDAAGAEGGAGVAADKGSEVQVVKDSAYGDPHSDVALAGVAADNTGVRQG